MKAGKDLDVWVAKKVLGLEVCVSKKGVVSLGEPDYYDDRGELILSNPVPNYSTSIADAWTVVEKMGMNWWFSMDLTGKLWHAQFESQEGIRIRKFGEGYSRESASHAICLAALMVGGVEV